MRNIKEQLGLKIRNKVELKIENERLIITLVGTTKRKKPKLDIEKLFKEEFKENEEFNWGKVGKEEW
ncbi:hypothetical protein [Persephonella sp.]